MRDKETKPLGRPPLHPRVKPQPVREAYGHINKAIVRSDKNLRSSLGQIPVVFKFSEEREHKTFIDAPLNLQNLLRAQLQSEEIMTPSDACSKCGRHWSHEVLLPPAVAEHFRTLVQITRPRA